MHNKIKVQNILGKKKLRFENKTSWDWAGPSSDQAGIRQYFNFLQIWFLPIWIDRIGLIEKIWFDIFGFLHF